MLVRLFTIAALLTGVSLPCNAKTVEYVFIDIWGEYNQPTALPPPIATRIFLQPDINIDEVSLLQFKKAHPEYATLEIDRHNQRMIALGVRQTPMRVVVEENTVIKRDYLGTEQPELSREEVQYPLQTLDGKAFMIDNMTSNFRVLFFSDSLCPFQHLPNCENKIKQNNQLAATVPYPVVTVIKPFYVDIQSAYDYQERFEVKQDIVFDHHNAVFSRFGIHELPYWLVQNQQGQVIYRGNQAPDLN